MVEAEYLANKVKQLPIGQHLPIPGSVTSDRDLFIIALNSLGVKVEWIAPEGSTLTNTFYLKRMQ